jgi:hypothetical protein
MVRVVLNNGFIASATVTCVAREQQRGGTRLRLVVASVSREPVAAFTGHIAEREGQIANDPARLRLVGLHDR